METIDSVEPHESGVSDCFVGSLGRNRNHSEKAGNFSCFVTALHADTPKHAPADDWLFQDAPNLYLKSGNGPAREWEDACAGRLSRRHQQFFQITDRIERLRWNSSKLQLYVSTERGERGLDARKFRRVMRIENAARFLLVQSHSACELGIANAGLPYSKIHSRLERH